MTEIPSDVTNAQAAATNAGKAYAESVAGGYSIGDELKKAVQNAYNYSQDVIGPFDTRTQQYLAGPAALREKYSNPQGENYVANPFSREKVVAQGVGNLATPMLALASILGQRFGRYQDLIGTGTNAYNAQTARLQGGYEAQKQTAQDLLANFKLKNELNATSTDVVDAGGRRLLINKQTGQTIKDLGATPASSGSSGFTINIPGLNNIGTGNTSTTNNKTNVEYQSPPWTASQPGSEQEWPLGSGVVWVSNSKGEWE